MKRSLFVGIVAAGAVVVSVAAGTAPVHGAVPAASIPGLRTSGTITFGTNFGYPPMEYFAGQNGTIQTGADVDLGTKIAARLHLKAAFVNVTDFGVIFTGLQSHRWDVIISSVNETPSRAKLYNFVPYMNVGQSILVRKGNPEHISTVADLSGKNVSVQTSTTEADTLTAENKTLNAQHKTPINVAAFAEDTTAVQGLVTGRYVAVLEDYPVVVYHATQQPALFQQAGKQFAATPYAVTFRKSDTVLRAQVAAALQSLRKDGTYKAILKKYGLSQASL